ncbi:interleukin-13 receptor subunit alpha-1-like isoform X1 [Conger conger]|uniref:interleukin-13 receptor subunit alpha-1-like isoform X1 n=1 Tax=Conger conger TaxID=82655 RepID=UPI002A59A7E8|nr:interleukin-13 receptor subunit alpha-1-like isoform X1 [Conger conger]
MDLSFRVLFLVTCCWTAFSLVSSETGALPLPSDVHLQFPNDFCVNLTWSPPEKLNSSTCSVQYHITVTAGQAGDPESRTEESTHYQDCPDMENGVTYAVRTQPKSCGNRTDSKEVFKPIPHRTEKLVKEFKCFYYMPGAMNCTWRPTDGTRDLQLYYWHEQMEMKALGSCGLYFNSGEDKTGCHLHGKLPDHTDIHILLNGTRGPSTLQNTFLLNPRKNLKPPPPNLSVSEEGHMLRLHCTPPDVFGDCWKCTYRYRSSRSSDWQEKYSSPDTPVHIPYNRHSRYEVQVMAVSKGICGIGATDWSKVTSFGEEQPADWSSHMALIAIPVVVIACVILFLLFFKKVRVLILPQIPKPMQLIKELINSKEEESNLAENKTVLQGKGSEKQVLCIPEEPEVCVNVRVEEPEPAADL